MRSKHQGRLSRAAVIAFAMLPLAFLLVSCGRSAPPVAAPAQPPDRVEGRQQDEDWLSETFEDEEGDRRGGIAPPRPAADERADNRREQSSPSSPDGRRG